LPRFTRLIGQPVIGAGLESGVARSSTGSSTLKGFEAGRERKAFNSAFARSPALASFIEKPLSVVGPIFGHDVAVGLDQNALGLRSVHRHRVQFVMEDGFEEIEVKSAAIRDQTEASHIFSGRRDDAAGSSGQVPDPKAESCRIGSSPASRCESHREKSE